MTRPLFATGFVEIYERWTPVMSDRGHDTLTRKVTWRFACGCSVDQVSAGPVGDAVGDAFIRDVNECPSHSQEGIA